MTNRPYDPERDREAARLRMRAWRERHEQGMSRAGRTCRLCGCRLSRYNHDSACSACEPSYTTHTDYMLDHDPAAERQQLLRGDNVCKRGHDLLEHGRPRRAEHGSRGRACKVCDAERQRLRRKTRASGAAG